jgi:tetratricopeptide (TPR) repeat protein
MRGGDRRSAPERVGLVRDQLADAAAQMGAARFDEAERQARAALAEAEGIDYPPLRVEAQARLGRILHAEGELEAAQATLQEALRLGHDTMAVEAGIPSIDTRASIDTWPGPFVRGVHRRLYAAP